MSGRMKIVIVGSAHPLRGGLATYNERLATELINEGHDVKIETFKLQYPSILFPGKTQYSDSPKPENLNIHVSVNSINPFNWLKIGRKIKKDKPDLLINKFWIPFMAPCLGTIARIAKRNKKTRVITIIDNIIPHEKRPGDYILSKYFANSVDGFISMSKSVQDDLLKFDQTKPRELTPHPLFDNFGEILDRNAALKALKLDTNFKYMLFFGFIRDYKGLDILLEALSDGWFTKNKVKLIVAGEFYNDPEKYHDIIREKNLEDQLIMHNDFISNEKVNLYFSAADIVVQPYKTATQSGVTQIGYHFNKPMLVTNVGGLAEIIPDQKVGYVVEPNGDAIAKALIDFFENNRKAEFEKNILEEKKKYSWDKMTAKIQSVYQKILENDHQK
ncbi:glycosyltransferase [Mariniphaga sediminis]|uniref:glycosyltransferase n=1 Tax=Mariniphaga sediminis TaxID=1628158 RepID=UPI00356A0CEC